MRVYHICLALIGIWMLYAWHRGILFTRPEQELILRQTELEKKLGFHPDSIVPKVFKYGLIYFVQFVSDPFNVTLVMMCLFSRIVLNFVIIKVHVNLTEIWFDYEIDESYFVPNNQRDPYEVEAYI